MTDFEIGNLEPWMTTYTGRTLHLFNPRQDEICIEDIAHHLSLICRFGGACKRFYSVAEHSIRLSMELPDQYKLAGLLDDAAEAYLGDWIRPLKANLSELEEIEYYVKRAIFQKFRIEELLFNKVAKFNDNRMLATEVRDLMGNQTNWQQLEKPFDWKIGDGLSIPDTELDFLSRFTALSTL
ncbi:MAG: hypothetical protein M0R06_00360 [Sphaerochaeta sp.]|jgi:hypothetical protein|nr:hypothetical protein [Sphaerochaeta sp.]